MRSLYRAVLALSVACLLLPSNLNACTPPPPGAVKKSLPKPGIKTVKANVLIRFVSLESASFPDAARVRVLEAKRGPFAPGQIILVQPMPGSACGPDRIIQGASGWVETIYFPKTKGDPLTFLSFTKPREK